MSLPNAKAIKRDYVLPRSFYSTIFPPSHYLCKIQKLNTKKQLFKDVNACVIYRTKCIDLVDRNLEIKIRISQVVEDPWSVKPINKHTKKRIKGL